MKYFEKRKLRKQLKTLLHHARTLRCSREDVMNAGERAYLDEQVQRAAAAYRTREGAAMEAAGTELEACLTRCNPPKPFAGWRENFDVLVVAISVAMAFRAYFYQPFKIPTGSMQPTLYGIHCEPRDPSQIGLLDRQPFKFVKWLVTGESFKVVKASERGTVTLSTGESRKPGYTPVVVAGVPHYVPNDAVLHDEFRRPYGLKGGVKIGDSVKSGDVLWSGVVVSGDFVFVNRWKWNFSHPVRGEVMVFSTSGITALQQGTHYIKRMTGLPNETLQIQAPNLLVNGRVVTEPERIVKIARKEKPWAQSPAYSGFNPSGINKAMSLRGLSLSDQADTVTLKGNQYYAMGDNSFNSYDSRFWGPVPERNLLGPATVVYWPFTSPRFGFIR